MTAFRSTLWHKDSIALLGADGGAALLFADPRGAIEAHRPEDIEDAFKAMEVARSDGLHLAGFFSYELGYVLEQKLAPILPGARRVPLLSFGLFDTPRRLSASETTAFLGQDGFEIGPSDAALLERAYDARFKRVHDYICAGDVYQINLTFPLRFSVGGSVPALFGALRHSARAEHTAYLALDGLSILSLSPELFLCKDGTRIRLRPMKGTAPRAPSQTADERVRRGLSKDAKNRAENLMIVDLLRNDLGRIAKTGSVRVPSLFEVETYPTLHQMVSQIEGEIASWASLADLVTALFPSGSITGAPKIRAMEIIRELEDAPRGIYCGAIGHIAPDGDLHFNVAIRTMTIEEDGRAEMGVGSGIVADSNAAAEYRECLLKSAFLTQDHTPFELIETFRWSQNDGYYLWTEHLARLAQSAAYFGFSYDADAIEDALKGAAARLTDTARRIRLTLSQSGDLAISDAPLPQPVERPLRTVLSDKRVSSADPFLRHKTTRRAVYESEFARLGADEVIFMNERGELTEGSRTNIFIERGGLLWTPAEDCGLLPGTLRAALLAQGKACEGVLTLDDLNSGDPLYLGNGLRGLMPACLSREARSPSAAPGPHPRG